MVLDSLNLKLRQIARFSKCRLLWGGGGSSTRRKTTLPYAYGNFSFNYSSMLILCQEHWNSNCKITSIYSILFVIFYSISPKNPHAIRRFSQLTKFSANCHLANGWSCFVEHKLQHPSNSHALVVLWYSSDLISQRLGDQIQAEVGKFFNF